MKISKHVMDNFVKTEEENGHYWGFYKKDSYESCAQCGLLRRSDKKSNPCKPTKITLRNKTNES